MLNRRIKHLLNDIIDVAYASEPEEQRKKYKNFILRILVKENTRSGGTYHCENHLIEVYNPSLGAKHLSKCCLHELSHHIDLTKNKKTGHQKPFYAEYAKLIYASLDMGILARKDFDDHWSSDQNKVRKIVRDYRPRPVNYKFDQMPVISVYNAFSHKENLKSAGYYWNKVEQTWEKQVPEERVSTETEKLRKQEIRAAEGKANDKGPYFVVRTPGMKIDAVVYIEASGNTYEKREALKKYDFYFKKDSKQWLRKIPAAEIDDLVLELSTDPELEDCDFNVLNRRDL